MAKKLNDAKKFLESYVLSYLTQKVDNTATRATQAQKLRQSKPSGKITKNEAAIVKSEAASAGSYILQETDRRNALYKRDIERRNAQLEYDKAAKRRKKAEDEFWGDKKEEVLFGENEEARNKLLNKADQQEDAAFKEWSKDTWLPVNYRNKFIYGILLNLSNLGNDATNVNISTTEGKISENDLKIAQANAHKLYVTLQNLYNLKLQTLLLKQQSGITISTQESLDLNQLGLQLLDTDLNQLNDLYKVDAVKETSPFTNVKNTLSEWYDNLISNPATTKQDARKRSQKRYQDYLNYYDNNKDEIEKQLGYKESHKAQILGTDPENWATVMNNLKDKDPINDLDTSDRYIARKERENKQYRADINITSLLLDKINNIHKVSQGFLTKKELYQGESLFTPEWWQYCFSGTVGSSNSSGALIAGNALQLAGMALGPAGYVAATAASTPLQIQGGLDENYAETDDRRRDNLKLILSDPKYKDILPDILKDAKIKSKAYYKKAGLSDEWIKDHTEGNGAEDNLIGDIIKGVVTNNSPIMKQALLSSMKGLSALRDADNMRTIGEMPAQLALQFMPIDKLLGSAFGYVRATAKSKIALRATNKSGKLAAEAEREAAETVAQGSRYSNGFRKKTIGLSMSEGWSVGKQIGDATGFGYVGSLIGGAAGTTVKGVGHTIKKIPTAGKWVSNVEETLMHKYLNVMDAITPDAQWKQLLGRYGLRSAKNMFASSMSEGSEEGVQYLNSKRDFANLYGYDGLTIGEMIANDLHQGASVFNSYTALLGLSNSALMNDKEYWNNVKGGFALGGHNPGATAIINTHKSVGDILKESDTNNAIIRSGVMNRERERINRASNAEFAAQAAKGRQSLVITMLQTMQQRDSRREVPNFTQEQYDLKIEDAKAVMAMSESNSMKSMLSAKGIKHGTHEYSLAISDIYNLNKQLQLNQKEAELTDKLIADIYNGKEFTDAVNKQIDDQFFTDQEIIIESSRKAREDGEKAVLQYIKENPNEKNLNALDDVRRKAEAESINNQKEEAKLNLISNTQYISQAKALLELIAKANTIADVQSFIERKTGLRSMKPDAKIVNDHIDLLIASIKNILNGIDKRITKDTTNDELLNYLNEITDLPFVESDELKDLESAKVMIQADKKVAQSYQNQFTYGLVKNQDGTYSYNKKKYKAQRNKAAKFALLFSEGKIEEAVAYSKLKDELFEPVQDEYKNDAYLRRINTIKQTNDENEKILWLVNDITSGDAVTALQETIEEEQRLEAIKDAEELSKQSAKDEISSENASLSNTKKADNKRKYLERKRKAKLTLYDKAKARRNKARSVDPISAVFIGAIQPAIDAISYLAKLGAYKIDEFISDAAEQKDGDLTAQDIAELKKAYIKETAKLIIKNPNIRDNISDGESVLNYIYNKIQITPTVVNPEVTNNETAKIVVLAILDRENKVDKLLSTYYHTIVKDEDGVHIYRNNAEIDLLYPWINDERFNTSIKKIIDELKLHNNSEKEFANYLESINIPKEYSKYRNVTDIYEVIAFLKNNVMTDGLLEAINVRNLAIAILTDSPSVSELAAQMNEPIDSLLIKSLQELKAKIKAESSILSTSTNIYGKDEKGNLISSLVDLITISEDCTIHVFDILNSIHSINETLDNFVGIKIYTRRLRETEMFKQINTILENSYNINVEGTTIIPIVSEKNNKRTVEDLITLNLEDQKEDDTLTILSVIKQINEYVEEYNSLEDDCKKLKLPFERKGIFVYEDAINPKDYLHKLYSEQDNLSTILDDLRNKIELKESDLDISETPVNDAPIETEETNTNELVQRLIDNVANLDAISDSVPAVAPQTLLEIQLVNSLYEALLAAQNALNDVLLDAEASTIDVTEQEQCIASVVEKLVLNTSVFGEQGLNVSRWWLTNFSLQSEDYDKNGAKAFASTQQIFTLYLNTIDSWLTSFTDHLINEIDDNEKLLNWYSVLLNTYFTKLLNNAQYLVDNVNDRKDRLNLFDYNTKEALLNYINEGRALISKYNDLYPISDEFFNSEEYNVYTDSTQDILKSINKPLRKWRGKFGTQNTWSPGFDKISNNGAYWDLSTRPDFLTNSEFKFRIDKKTGEVVVDILYKSPDPIYGNRFISGLSFVTDINAYINNNGELLLTQNQLLNILNANRANKRFTDKIKELLNAQQAKGELRENYEISCQLSTNKGSLIYDKTKENNVLDFLFSNESNAHDLYNIQLGEADNIGLFIKYNIGLPTEGFSVNGGMGIRTQIKSFDLQYAKGNPKFYTGTILYNYDTGNGQKIPVPLNRSKIGKDAQSLYDIISKYLSGDKTVEDFDILELLKMRLYINDNSRKSPYNNQGNRITLDTLHRSVRFGTEQPLSIIEDKAEILDKLANMPNMLNAELLNRKFMSDQNPILVKTTSIFKYDRSVQSISLPNGFVITRDDVENNSTWLGYLLRNGVITTDCVGLKYKLINFGNPILVKKQQTEELQNKQIETNAEQKKESLLKEVKLTKEEILKKLGAVTTKVVLNDSVNSNELVDRSEKETDNFRKAAKAYFEKVFGTSKDLNIEDYDAKPSVNGKVAVGYCSSLFVSLAKNAPESSIFHEAFHRVMELLLNNDERTYFYNQYRNKFGETLLDRDVAEGLCDLFVDYMEHYTKVKKAKGFGKLYTKFKNIAFRIGMYLSVGHTLYNKYTQLYSDINNGKFVDKLVSDENIKRFNTVFNDGTGISKLYYTVENTDLNKSVDFLNITNFSDLEDISRSVAYMAVQAEGLDAVGSDPKGFKINENTPNRISKWLKRTIGITLLELLENGALDPAFSEIFESKETIILDKEGNQVRDDNGFPKTKRIYPKFDVISKHVSDYLSDMLGEYKGKLKLDDDDEDDTAQKSNIDKYDKAAYEFSKLDSTTARVKFFFSTIPYMKEDGSADPSVSKFGYYQYMPLDEVYNIIINDCHDAESMSDLDHRLLQLLTKSPMHKVVYDRYHSIYTNIWETSKPDKNRNRQRRINFDNECLAVLIFKCIKSQKVDFIVALSKNKNGQKSIRITSSSSDRDSRQYPKQWTGFLLSGQIPIFNVIRDKNGALVLRKDKENTFKDVASFFEQLRAGINSPDKFKVAGKEYIKGDPDSLKDLCNDIVNNLYTIGIIVPKEAFEYMLRNKYSKNGLNPIQGYSFDGILAWLNNGNPPYIGNFIGTIKKFIINGKINQNLVTDGYVKLGFIKDLGNAVGEYNRMTVQQMTNALNGKKVYSISQNNSISYIADAINTLNKENELVSTLMGFGYNFHRDRNFSYGSILLKKIENGDKFHINLHTYLGLKTDNKNDGGTEYAKTSNSDDYIAKMAMLLQGYMIFPTLADKGTWVCMSGITLPGMTFLNVEKRDTTPVYDEHGVQIGTEEGNIIGYKNIVIDAPSVITIGGKRMLKPSNTVLDLLIEYAELERLAIQQCMEDLGYKDIPGYTKTGRALLKDNAKIKNYHTPNGKIEPNGTRFLSLTQSVDIKDNNFEIKNLNDPNKSSVDMLKEANKYFFDKTQDEKRLIMAVLLDLLTKLTVSKMQEFGLIERQSIKYINNGNDVTLLTSDNEDTYENMTSSLLNLDQINALTEYFLNTIKTRNGMSLADEKNSSLRAAYVNKCKGYAIAAIINDVENRSIMSAEEIKRCFSGHPALFKVKYDMSAGVIKDSTFDIQKRIGGMISTGEDNVLDLHGIKRLYVCAEMKDYEVASTSNVSNNLENMFLLSLLRELAYDHRLNSEDDPYLLSEEELLSYISKLISENKIKQEDVDKANNNSKVYAGAYSEGINVADGAAYITSETCKNMIRMNAGFTEDVRKAFSILESPKHNIDWMESSEAFKQIYNAVNIVSTKYTAYGFRTHILNNEKQSDVAVAYYNKFALFPLFDCLATGRLSSIYNKMKNEKVDMLLMDSAVKIGSQAPVKFDGTSINAPFNTYIQDFGFLRKQLNTDPEEGNLSSIKTQMMKICLLNLKLDRTYIHRGTNKQIYGKELFAEYMLHIDNIARIGVEKVKERFFTDNRVDVRKLSSYLKQQLGTKGVSKNLIDALLIIENEDGTLLFTCPLAATTDASWMESIIISSINKEVIDINTPGSSFVQRSVFAMEATGAEGSIQGQGHYNGKKLQMINEEGSMDAIVSIDYFQNILPKGLSFTQAREWLIDNNIIGDNAKAMCIGYRIPTQAESSIHSLRFLDIIPAVKSTIILPEEFTKITGSDFDIDHLYLNSYNFGIDKQVISYGGNENMTITTASATDYNNLTEELIELNKLFDCIITLLNDSGNSMLYLYKSIDNDTPLVEKKATLIPVIGSTKHYAFNFGTLREQVDRRNDYVTGKTGIGPFALNSVNHTLTLILQVKLRDTLFTRETGIESLGVEKDNNGDYVASWLSAFINAHVDIVKDPYVSRINVNLFTYNMINFLVRVGKGEAGVWFLSQPIMRDLATAYSSINSQYVKSNNITKTKALQDAYQKVLDKYDISFEPNELLMYLSEALQSNRDIISQEAQADIVNEIINNNISNLKDVAIGNHNMSTGEFNLYLKKIYLAFKTLEKYSVAMSNMVQLTKIDTKKHGKTFIDIINYLYKYEKMINAKNSIIDTESLLKLVTETWIQYKTNTAITLPLQIMGDYTFDGNKVFLNAIYLILNGINETLVNLNTVKLLSKHYQTALKSKYFAEFAKLILCGNNEDVYKYYMHFLFYGDKNGNSSMSKRLNGLKIATLTNQNYYRLRLNYLLQSLSSQLASDDADHNKNPQFIQILSKIDGSRVEQNRIIEAWKDLLYDSDLHVRKFANDLVMYAFFTSGNFNGWNKLFKYVPMDWIIGKTAHKKVVIDGYAYDSYAEYVQTLLYSGDFLQDTMEQYTDQVVQNNYNEPELCPSTPQTFKIYKKSVLSYVLSPSKNVLILTLYESYDNAPAYILIRANNGVNPLYNKDIYKKIKKVTISDGIERPCYVRRNKLGYNTKNNSIYEYSINIFNSYRQNINQDMNNILSDIGRMIPLVSTIIRTYYRYSLIQFNNLTATSILDDTEIIDTPVENDRITIPNLEMLQPLNNETQLENDTHSLITKAKDYYTRESVKNDPRTLYIFTDNTDRTSGGILYEDGWYKLKYGEGGFGSYRNPTTAAIRGLLNAAPISTMKWFYKNHDGATILDARWEDSDFNQFKSVIDSEILDIKNLWDSNKFKYIILPGGDGFFNTKISNISLERTPKLYEYLKQKQLELENYVNNNESNSNDNKNFNGKNNDESNFNNKQLSTEIISSDKTILSNLELNLIKPFTGNKPRIAVASEHSDPVFFSKKIINILNGEEAVRDKFRNISYSGKDFDALYLITKHDGLPLKNLLETKIPKIIHFSITGLGGTKWEPGVMKYNDLLDRIQEFIKQGLDPNMITIRIDPIIPGVTKRTDIEQIIKRSSEMGVKNIRFSIMDKYSTTLLFMEKLGYDYDKWYPKVGRHANPEIISLIEDIMLLLSQKYNVNLSTCAEPIVKEGISQEACLSVNAINQMLGTSIPQNETGNLRLFCSCYGGKTDLLSYNDNCASSCVYCYAHHNNDRNLSYYNEDGTLKDNVLTLTQDKLSTPTNTDKEDVSNTNSNDYIMNSGGAYGGDTVWDFYSRKYGITNIRHYRDSANTRLSGTLDKQGIKATPLNKEEMDFAREKVKELLGKEYKNDLRGNLQVRNFYLVYNSDGVFAIATLNNSKNGVSGGTNTAVQLGISLNKETHVFDINSEKWYIYNKDSKEFEIENTPKLTKSFAGVGTRDILNYNILDKNTNKWVSRQLYVGDIKKNVAFNAIEDVMKNTFGNTTDKWNILSEEDRRKAEEIKKHCKGE